jgi:tetratricopeptide (TPR) repeat protein
MAKGKQVRRPVTSAVKEEEVLVDIVDIRNQAQSFYERYQNFILIGAAALALLIGGIIAWRWYTETKQVEAIEQMAQAQKQFERDSFAMALTNPGGGFSGFLDIIDNYGGTKAANLSCYYAGVCYLNLGKFEVAIDYLKDFSAKGDIMPIMKNGALGDCYAETKNFDKAMSYYKSAASAGDNDFLTPYYLKKVAMLAQKRGDNAAARDAFQKIKDKYPTSAEGQEAEKYLIYLEGK